MPQSFDLNIRYSRDDRALVRGIRQQLAETKKLDSALRSLRREQQALRPSSSKSAFGRMTDDVRRLRQELRAARREAVALGAGAIGGRGGAPSAHSAGLLSSASPLAFLGRMVAPAAIGYSAYRMGRGYFSQWAAEDQASAYYRSIGGNPAMAQRLAGIGSTYAKNRTDIILGGYQALSSGVSGDANVYNVVRHGTALAATNPIATVEDSVKALTLAGNAYAKNGVADFSDASVARVKDMLARTVEKGVIEMPELTAQLGDPLSIAPIAGVSLQEVLATMGTMSLKGINAAEGATATKNLLNKIVNPTDESRELARALGVDLSKAGLQKAGGLPQLMGQLVTAANRKGDEGLELLLDVFPELRAAKAALAGFSDPSMWNDFYAALENSTGAAERMAEVAQDNVSSQLKLFGNNVLDAAMRAGEASGLFGTIKDTLRRSNESLTGAAGKAYAGTARGEGTLATLTHNPYSAEANKVLDLNPHVRQVWEQEFARAKSTGVDDLQAATAAMEAMPSYKRLFYGNEKDTAHATDILYNRVKLREMNELMAASNPSTESYRSWRTDWRDGFLATTGMETKAPALYPLFNRTTDDPRRMQSLVQSWSDLPQEKQTSLGGAGIAQLLVRAISSTDQRDAADPEAQAFNAAVAESAETQRAAGSEFAKIVIAAAQQAALAISSAQPGSPLSFTGASGSGGLRTGRAARTIGVLARAVFR